MFDQSNQAYYAKRAAQEREYARTCDSNIAATKHFELAEEYEARARGRPARPSLIVERH